MKLGRIYIFKTLGTDQSPKMPENSLLKCTRVLGTTYAAFAFIIADAKGWLQNTKLHIIAHFWLDTFLHMKTNCFMFICQLKALCNAVICSPVSAVSSHT